MNAGGRRRRLRARPPSTHGGGGGDRASTAGDPGRGGWEPRPQPQRRALAGRLRAPAPAHLLRRQEEPLRRPWPRREESLRRSQEDLMGGSGRSPWAAVRGTPVRAPARGGGGAPGGRKRGHPGGHERRRRRGEKFDFFSS
ncbi:hypothetical protein PVAP13_5KG461807 [Panicum virgatum]|uniref:Uncharacterized protein n=1 Tax=Panicum virgatum TaxID=38727 RepID=A0A8T0SID1_PANVG|nr:hypothetical protein PVAP13_5KG461807 [Panicum virgatum]